MRPWKGHLKRLAMFAKKGFVSMYAQPRKENARHGLGSLSSLNRLPLSV